MHTQLQEIQDHIITGLMFHSDMANYYDFLGLKGYKRLHEEQAFIEMVRLRIMQRYLINKHHILPNDLSTKSYNAIPKEWFRVTAMQIDEEIAQKGVKDGMAKYLDWETVTLDFYTKTATVLAKNGEITLYRMICGIIEETDEELKDITRTIKNLEKVGYDMEYVILLQDELHDDIRDNKMDKVLSALY